MQVKFQMYAEEEIEPELKTSLRIPIGGTIHEQEHVVRIRLAGKRTELKFSNFDRYVSIDDQGTQHNFSLHLILSDWEPKVGDELLITEESDDQLVGSQMYWQVKTIDENRKIGIRDVWLEPSKIAHGRSHGTEDSGPS